jgi:hypothetical protein
LDPSRASSREAHDHACTRGGGGHGAGRRDQICEGQPRVFARQRTPCVGMALFLSGNTLGASYGPPFADPTLQAAYVAEWKKLADSSVFITESTARSLVASVMNSALAAADSAVPRIKSEVEKAVRGQIPVIEREVAKVAKEKAGEGARTQVGKLLIMSALAGVTAHLSYLALRSAFTKRKRRA